MKPNHYATQGLFKKATVMSFILIFAFILNAAPGIAPIFPLTVTASAVHQTKVPDGYKGVYNVADLYGIRNDLSSDYILMNDIDLTVVTAPGGEYDFGNGWDPIDDFGGMYGGTFDGNGYQIKGMQIFGELELENTNNMYIGLFGYTHYANITNLALVDSNIDITVTQTYNNYYGNCNIYVGMIIASGSNIENCFSSGNIDFVFDSADNRTLGGVRIGGIAGYGNHIENCHSDVSINVSSNYQENKIGGIGGYVNAGDIFYSIGKITINNFDSYTTYVAPNDGSDDYYRYTKYSYYLNGIIGNLETKDLSKPLTKTQMTKEESFTGFDFESTWYIDKYCGYDYPQLYSAPVVPIEKVLLTQTPDEVSYFEGEDLNITGGEIEIVYKNGVTVPLALDESMIGSYDMNKIGEQKISVNVLGYTGSYDIEILETPVQKVMVDKTSYTVNQGSKFTLSATALPENATNRDITWSSSDTSIARVTSGGVVTGMKPGTATITAKAKNGIQGKCKVTVVKSTRPTETVTLNKKTISLDVGGKTSVKRKLTPSNSTDKVMWFSSNTAVATVSSKGTVTAKGKGKCTITAVTSNGKSASCAVTVTIPFVLDKNEVKLSAKKTYTVDVISAPTTKITYKSMNKSVATVNSKGVITAVKKGETTIIATCGGETQAITVTVK